MSGVNSLFGEPATLEETMYEATNILGGILLVALVISLPLAIAKIVAFWKMYKKAGEKGWASLIPFYSGYVLYRMTWGRGIVYLIPLFLGVGSFISCVSLFVASFTYSAIGIMISWLLGIVLNIASIAMLLITKYKLSRVFGHDVDYFIGLIFLPLIFYLILGFGSSTYTCPPNHSRLKG